MLRFVARLLEAMSVNFNVTVLRLVSDTAESAKEMASRGVESAKEAGSKAADKGHGQ